MSTRERWTAWLGPAADNVTDAQLIAIDAASDAINARWPEPDLAELRESALSAAVQVIVGDETLESHAAAWHAIRGQEQLRHAALTGALIASSTGARSGKGSEADLVTRSGASRLTVRKALRR